MRRPGWAIGTRLLVAQAMVLVAAIATAGSIATIVGPSLFHAHLLEASENPEPEEVRHVEEAFRAANAISLGVAMAAATAIALVVSWYLTRRFQSPLNALTRAASAVTKGDYGAQVRVDAAAGPEIAQLAGAFNSMAAQLAHTEETRRRLLSDLAHELRTPIATLSAYLDGLEDGVAVWDGATRSVLADQVARLARLARDIDDVSRAEEGRVPLELAPVGIGQLIDAAVLAHAESFSSMEINLTVAPGPDVSVTGDRVRLLQVLANVLDNARRHTQPRGSVTLAWSRDHDGVAITISDDGDGIPTEQLSHVFERFYRGDSARDREHQGSGIGLTLSKGIVEAHGGEMSVESAGAGFGTAFRIRLPL